jgi:hypothetical protein
MHARSSTRGNAPADCRSLSIVGNQSRTGYVNLVPDIDHFGGQYDFAQAIASTTVMLKFF